MIWLTTPMQGSPKKRSILANADWLRATAKESKFKCTFRYRTSIPYGKGKDVWCAKRTATGGKVSIPYGKGKGKALK